VERTTLKGTTRRTGPRVISGKNDAERYNEEIRRSGPRVISEKNDSERYNAVIDQEMQALRCPGEASQSRKSGVSRCSL
jgi:hypothetical protein